RGSSGTAPAGASVRATAHAGSRAPMPERSRTAGCLAASSTTAGGGGAGPAGGRANEARAARRSRSAAPPRGRGRTPPAPGLVPPAPGVPGAVPFWKGEGVGRPFELGQKIGAASRELSGLSEAKARTRLRDEYHLEERATANLVQFIREQQDATGGVPTDRTIVVERFRDEIGDWRVCILTPFCGRVRAPWAMAIAARLREGQGIEAQSIWSDDGIALHFPESDSPPSFDDLQVDPADVEDLVVAELGDSALFGSR